MWDRRDLCIQYVLEIVKMLQKLTTATLLAGLISLPISFKLVAANPSVIESPALAKEQISNKPKNSPSEVVEVLLILTFGLNAGKLLNRS